MDNTFHGSSLAYLAAGFISVFLLESVIRNVSKTKPATAQENKMQKRKPKEKKREDVLALSSLAELVKSGNVSLKENALRILLDR